MEAFYSEPHYAPGMLEFWNRTGVEMFRRFEVGAPKRLLDVGSGSGALVVHAVAAGIDAWGIEPFWPLSSDRVLRGFAETLPFDTGSFDAVTNMLTLASVEDPKRSMSEMARVLQPGGRAYVAISELSAYPRMSRGIRHITSRKWFVSMLDSSWSVDRVRPFGLKFVVPVFRRLHVATALPTFYWRGYPWLLSEIALFTLTRR